MKILWHSNAPHSPTGYGNQTRVFLPRLQQLGHEVICSAFYGVQGAPMVIAGIDTYPNSKEPYGNDVLAADAHQLEADIVITLIDIWVLAPDVTRQFRWVPYMPVDHEPLPPAMGRALKTAWQPIVYSQFGKRMVEAEGHKPLYVPHAVDTSVFKPHDAKEQRRERNWPEDAFMVGIVAANKGAPSRKAFDQQIRGFAKFHAHHPDAVLYLHTDWLGVSGIDIRRLVQLSGLPDKSVIECPRWPYARGLISWEWMAGAYSAMDVLLNATKGEGFGIPIIEAQACGTPVIVTDWTAMPELVRSGWTVGYSDKFYSQESYQVTPSVDDIADKLELAYQRRGDQDFRQQARDAMVKEYDADHVTETYWKPVLEKLDKKRQKEAGRKRVAVIDPKTKEVIAAR